MNTVKEYWEDYKKSVLLDLRYNKKAVESQRLCFFAGAVAGAAIQNKTKVFDECILDADASVVIEQGKN